MDDRYMAYAQQRTLDKVTINAFVRNVYNWMAVGLALTAAMAFLAEQSGIAMALARSPMLFLVLAVVEIGMVVYFSARIYKMEAGTATAVFLGYSALNGLTLSLILLAYTRASIASTFLVCAGTFAAVSLYGYTTKKDLTSMGSFMIMGLIGIIIASLVNFFLKSPAMDMAISYIGVFIFVGLTAYDTQKIKQMAETQPIEAGASAMRKAALFGALSLYLDFINLFIMLLRIMGDRR